MAKLSRLKVIFVLIMLVFSAIIFLIPQPNQISAKQSKGTSLFTFNSYIDIEYDSSVLNDPLDIHTTTTVPVNISYRTDIPEKFLWFLPWQLRNFILFHQIVAPMQMIHLRIQNEPEWANISFSQPELLIDIPFQGHVQETQTLLTIQLYENAPAEHYTLIMEASCEDIWRINGYNYTVALVFTPAWIPCLSITADQYSVLAPPNQCTNVTINITNCGNGITGVICTLIDTPSEFIPFIHPSSVEVDVNETEQVIFEVTPPNDFNGVRTMELEFAPYRFPPTGETGIPTMVYIRIYYP